MTIIKLYVYYIISAFIHEFGHFITLKLFGIKVTRFSMGNFFYLNIGKIKISPIILKASIEFSNKEFSELKLVHKLIIISSGALMNVLTYLLFPESKMIFRYISLLVGMTSLLPLPYIETDGTNFIKEIFSAFSKRRFHTSGNR